MPNHNRVGFKALLAEQRTNSPKPNKKYDDHVAYVYELLEKKNKTNDECQELLRLLINMPIPESDDWYDMLEASSFFKEQSKDQ